MSRGCLPGTRDANRIVPSSADLPQVVFVMVSRDHTPSGPMAAFFKESMRREAMTGTKIVLALQSVSCRYRLLARLFGAKEGRDLHRGDELDVFLNTCARYKQNATGNRRKYHVTYRGDKQKQQGQNLGGEYEHEVFCRVSKNVVQDTRYRRISGHPWSPRCDYNDGECKDV